MKGQHSIASIVLFSVFRPGELGKPLRAHMGRLVLIVCSNYHPQGSCSELTSAPRNGTWVQTLTVPFTAILLFKSLFKTQNVCPIHLKFELYREN